MKSRFRAQKVSAGLSFAVGRGLTKGMVGYPSYFTIYPVNKLRKYIQNKNYDEKFTIEIERTDNDVNSHPPTPRCEKSSNFNKFKSENKKKQKKKEKEREKEEKDKDTSKSKDERKKIQKEEEKHEEKEEKAEIMGINQYKQDKWGKINIQYEIGRPGSYLIHIYYKKQPILFSPYEVVIIDNLSLKLITLKSKMKRKTEKQNRMSNGGASDGTGQRPTGTFNPSTNYLHTSDIVYSNKKPFKQLQSMELKKIENQGKIQSLDATRGSVANAIEVHEKQLIQQIREIAFNVWEYEVSILLRDLSKNKQEHDK